MKWINIKEQLPPVGRLIIIYFNESMFPLVGYILLEKKLFSKRYKFIWHDDSGNTLNEKYISYWALLELPQPSGI